jgi:hypothetical protein
MAESGDPSSRSLGVGGESSWLRDAAASFVDEEWPQRLLLQPGTLVSDRFAIEALAGRGGMGAVYRATDRVTGEPVAVKVIARAREHYAQRLSREARVLAELHHPAIVRYVADGELPDGAPYLVMEWLGGEDLARRLAGSGLDVQQTFEVMRRACEGLAIAHSRGVVHRDLKPSNLFLVGGDPSATKVLDFGIALPASGSGTLTRTGTVVGTVGYMAPEQAMGAAGVDARADVFALGCVLFECLTGRPAFAGSHHVAVLAKVLKEDPPLVSELRPGLGQGFDSLVSRLLAKDRDARPADTGVVLAELAALGSMHGSSPPRELGGAPALTDSERRIVSVLLGTPRSGTPGVELGPGRLDDLARRFGVEAQTLRDGGVLLVPKRRDAATDQATRVARCAFALRALRPDLRLAVATGTTETTSRVPVGAAIDRAADLLAGSSDGGVAVDDVTAGLLGARFDVQRTEGRFVLTADLGDFESPRLLMGKPTPCVGRERELALLEATLAECDADHVARAVLVTAPPGTGKSRLTMEFVTRARERGTARVVFARPDPIASGSPLLVAQKLVRYATSLRDGDPTQAQHAALRAHLAGRVPDDALDRVTEFLAELVGAPPDDRVASPLLRAARSDPEVMREQTRRAFAAWVDAESHPSRGAPLLLVLEDLHWGDAPSVALVDEALKRHGERPLMVLALGRPEVRDKFPRMWASAGLQEVALGGLSRRAAERFVHAVIGASADAERIARAVEVADGNAFYLEELVRHIAEGSTTLPETVLAMAQSRLEHLEPEARRVLRAASVFGETCWAGGVAALVGAGVDAPGWLETLADRELLVRSPESRFRGEREFLFRHALLHDAAYAMLTDDDRVLAHARAGEWLEGTGDREARVIADHFERGKLPARAVPWLAKAARAAFEADDLLGAKRLADRGLVLGASGADRGELLTFSAIVDVYQATPPLEQLQEALDLLPAASSSWWMAVAGTTWGAMASDRPDVAAPLLLRVLGTPAGPLTGTLGLSMNGIALTLVVIGQVRAVWVLVEHFERAASQERELDPIFAAWLDTSRCAASLMISREGDRRPEHAYAFGRDAVAGMNACGSRNGEAMALAMFAQACTQVGRYDETVAAAERGRQIALEIGNVLLDYSSAYPLGWARLRLGAPGEAASTVGPTLSSNDAVHVAAARTVAAEANLAQGNLAHAAREGDILMREAPITTMRCWGACIAACAYLEQGQLDEALDAVSRGLGEASAGYVETEVSLLTVRAEALQRRGDRVAARDAIRQACDLVRRVAAGIQDEALRASYLTRVPANRRALELAEAWA